jgi:CubicO group peptidase (beta-lactamase class C family)
MNQYLNLRYALLLMVAVFMLPLTAQDKIQRVAQSLRTDIVREGAAPMTLADRMQHYNVPGVSIAVVQDFQLVGVKTYGLKEAGAPAVLNQETPFQSASISKLVNAVGIMKLVEAGKLDLDQNVNEILKGWQIPASSDYPNAVVTTRMLLTHSAGLSNHGFDGYKSAEGLPSVLEILTTAKGVKANPMEFIREPGTTFKYSGGGTLVTQLMVEELSGKSYPEYMQEAVLQPLGMTNSFYSVNQAGREAQLATAHFANGKPRKNKYQHYPESAAGGLWSTPTDLSKVMIDLMLAFNGEEGRLLKPETAKAMLLPTEASGNCALGLFRNDKDGHLYFEHSGANEGFMANFVGSTSGGFGAIVMQNGEQFDLVPEVLNAIATVYGWDNWFTNGGTIAADFTVDKSFWKSYQGHYVSEKDASSSFDVKVKKGALIMSRPGAWSLPLIPTNVNEYLLQGASPAVTVAFMGDGELRVTQGEVIVYRRE